MIGNEVAQIVPPFEDRANELGFFANQRFIRQYVETSRRHLARSKRHDQSVRVDQAAACGVDNDNAIPHKVEGALRQHVAGFSVLALTLGDQGALAVTRKNAWRAYAPKVKVVSTVGAGDSFLAAMILQLAAGADVAEALRYGVAGGAALLAPGTDLAHPPDTERLIADVTLEKVT